VRVFRQVVALAAPHDAEHAEEAECGGNAKTARAMENAFQASADNHLPVAAELFDARGVAPVESTPFDHVDAGCAHDAEKEGEQEHGGGGGHVVQDMSSAVSANRAYSAGN
jgi:hypothetical protein